MESCGTLVLKEDHEHVALSITTLCFLVAEHSLNHTNRLMFKEETLSKALLTSQKTARALFPLSRALQSVL